MADESAVSHLWYIGVIVVALGSLAGAGGDTMVRRAYVKAGNDATPKQMLKSPMFVIGMLLTVVLDPVCTFVALLFAPSSIVTPFAGVHIFWAVFIAHFWLKERMGWMEVLGSIGIVTGVILMVCFCGTQADIGSISAFDSYARTPGAIAYIAVSSFLLIVILILAFSFYPCSLGSWDYSVRRLATALASGFLGGNSNVAAKFFSIILMDLFAGHTSIFGNWRTYVVTLCTAVLCLGQLIFLNVSLRRYEAIYVVPTINSCLVAEGTIGSILVLHEVPKNWTAFSIGLVLCIAGILVLTTAHKIQPLRKKTLSMEMAKTPAQELGALEAGEAAGVTPETKADEDAAVPSALEKSPSKKRLGSLTRSFSRSATAVMDMSIVLNSKAFYSMYTMQEHHLPLTDDVPEESVAGGGSAGGWNSSRSSSVMSPVGNRRRRSSNPGLPPPPFVAERRSTSPDGALHPPPPSHISATPDMNSTLANERRRRSSAGGSVLSIQTEKKNSHNSNQLPTTASTAASSSPGNEGAGRAGAGIEPSVKEVSQASKSDSDKKKKTEEERKQ